MMQFHLTGDTADIQEGAQIVSKRLGVQFSTCGTEVVIQSGCAYLEVYEADGVYHIHHRDRAELFRGLSLLCDAVKTKRPIAIKEKRQFATTGSMLDVSRGFVFKKEVVMDLIERIALMGMNMFMLYTEDTYALEEYPWFGYQRGTYTIEEMKEIDDHAYRLGVEVIPCIQTLGHLRTALRWPVTAPYRDTANVLLVGAEETYVLIDTMLRTMRQAFRSNRIHIGMDETMGIGTGKYKKLHGERDTADIITEHLARVCQIADTYGYKPMMWSDMMFRLSGKDGEYELTAEIPADVPAKIPENIEMVYWDYCMEDETITDTVLHMHQDIQRPTVFAGGIWTWNRMCTCYKKSFDTARNQLAACQKNGVSTVFTTIWGNAYSYFSLYSILPSLQAWMELSYDPSADREKIAQRFAACTGYTFEDWALLFPDDFTDEELRTYKHSAANCFCINSSIQHFYNDVLTGLLDVTLSGYDFKSKYARLREGIAHVEAGDMQNVFERHRILYDILYSKCDLGPRLRTAYTAHDRAALEALAEEMTDLVRLYGEYHRVSGEMWFALCKPFGYNALDMELGGIHARIQTAKNRLDSYLRGDVERLEELEAEIFPYNGITQPLFETALPRDFMSVFG